MGKSVVRISLVGVVATLLLAACGGGSGGSGSGSGTGTNAGGGSAFATAANAACQKRSTIQQAASDSAGTTAQSAIGFTKTLASAYEAEISSLKALMPPASAKAQFDAFIADQESILTNLHNATRDAEKNDATAYGSEQQHALATALTSFPKAAAAGLPICAEKLPPADEAAVKKLAVQGAVHPTASLCTQSVTQHFLATSFGGSVSKCQKNIVSSHASSAQVTQAFGIVPSATVYLSQQGANPPKLLLGLVKENGTWKVDSVNGHP